MIPHFSGGQFPLLVTNLYNSLPAGSSSAAPAGGCIIVSAKLDGEC